MIPHVPFLRSNLDLAIYKDHYIDAPFVRIALDKIQYLTSLPKPETAWIDLGFDGVPSLKTPRDDDKYQAFINRHGDIRFANDAAFQLKPDVKRLTVPVEAMLDEALAFNPGFISIPQLPQEDDVGPNKVNRLLASIAGDWRSKRKAKVCLILPVIFTSPKQLTKKTDRNPRIKQICSLIERSEADGIWSVDASLDDQRGVAKFETERFPGIIDFFEEFGNACKVSHVIAGPYWGLNIVLWARGLITHLAIGLGSTYTYHCPGGFRPNTPNARIAIACLRRWVNISFELRSWLEETRDKLATGSPERLEVESLLLAFPGLQTREAGKKQIARVYREWLNKLGAMSASGRALGLYQDLSSAFVTGRTLQEFPPAELSARRPERVAQQLMMNCL